MVSLYDRLLGRNGQDGNGLIEPQTLRALLVLFRQPSPEYTVLQATSLLQLVDDQPAELQAILDTMPASQIDRLEWTDRAVAYCWQGRQGDSLFQPEGIRAALGIPEPPPEP
jgi:hypothetical protein